MQESRLHFVVLPRVIHVAQVDDVIGIAGYDLVSHRPGLGAARSPIADQGRVQQDLVGRRALPAFLRELHIELDLGGAGFVCAVRVEDHPDAGARIDLEHDLAGLRPTAGDIWTEGESYTIRWRATGIARVNVGLALGGKDKGHAALDLPASADSLHWRVPQGFVSGFGLDRSDEGTLVH